MHSISRKKLREAEIYIDSDGKRASEKPIRHKVNARKWHHQHEAKRQQQQLANSK